MFIETILVLLINGVSGCGMVLLESGIERLGFAIIWLVSAALIMLIVAHNGVDDPRPSDLVGISAVSAVILFVNLVAALTSYAGVLKMLGCTGGACGL